MSGKRARNLRKKKFPSKRVLALGAGLLLSCAPLCGDSELLVGVFSPFTKPFGEAHEMQYGTGAGLKITYRPVQLLNIFAQGQYLTMAMPATEPIKVMDASLGAGYHLKLSDHFDLDINASGGAYSATAFGRKASGFTAGLSLGFTYKISPVISADANISAAHYAAGSKPLMLVNAGISPGVTFNITEIFNKKSNVEMTLESLEPVFPALYSWYEKNTFGQVKIFNNEDSAITDVTVSFYQPQYMAHAKECATIRRIEQGESADVDLLAFFNEQMLELTEKSDTNSVVIINYLYLGQKRTKSFSLDVPVYGRNNMSWDDDRRAAVFVSSKDPAAMHFAKNVTSIVRSKKRPGVPVNIQYALGIFEALNQFGINYVVDPSSAFEDNVGTSSIDFLQFPYQTLMYKGGDCDDLSILFCSLFEAVGIRTAFITIPGHIYMAFDSGMSVEEADEKLRSLGNYIEIDDQVWIPLEITLTDEGFYKAFKYGAREWNRAYEEGTAAIYIMEDSWKTYPPISVPGATAKFSMPSSRHISMAFDKSVDTWSFNELNDILQLRPAKMEIAKAETDLAEAAEENSETVETVIKEDPFSDESLYEVLALSGQSFAMLNTPGVKVRKEDDEKKDDKPEDEPEPDLIADEEADDEDELSEEEKKELALIPVIEVNVLGPEDLGIGVPEAAPLGLIAEAKPVEENVLPVESSAAFVVTEPAVTETSVAESPVKEAEPAEPAASEVSVTQAAVSEPVATESAAAEISEVTEITEISEVADSTVSTETSEEKENTENTEKKVPLAPIAAVTGGLAASAAAGSWVFRKRKGLRGK